MSETGFYNTNSNRFYPLNAAEAGLVATPHIHSAMVDFGCILGPGTGFDPAVDKIYLARIQRVGDTFTFTIAGTAGPLFAQPLVFTRELTDEPFTSEFVEEFLSFDPAEDSVGASDEDAAGCPLVFLWSGFLVTGDLTELGENIPAETTFEGQVEFNFLPELIRDLSSGFVNTLNLANADRTRAEAGETCDPLEWGMPLDQVYPTAQCLQGPIRLQAGYNLSIQQNSQENEIELSAVAGAGLGQPCEEVPLFEGEEPPEGRETLDGSLRCNDVVRSINGIGGRVLNINGGKGVSVFPDPENNKVVVRIDMSDLQTCFVEEIEEVSESV